MGCVGDRWERDTGETGGRGILVEKDCVGRGIGEARSGGKGKERDIGKAERGSCGRE